MFTWENSSSIFDVHEHVRGILLSFSVLTLSGLEINGSQLATG